MANNFYVYLHRNGSGVFYVGKGTRERATSEFGRGKSWHKFSSEGYFVQIVKQELSSKEALELESQLISIYNPPANVKLNSSVILIDYEQAKNALSLDSESPTGLIWKKTGKVAGGLNKGTGYYVVRLKGTLLQAHRVVYLLSHGSIDSDLVVDHIDGDRLNNSIDNLRLVEKSKNNFNKAKKDSNSIDYRNGAYIVYWRVNGRKTSKSFSTKKHPNALHLAIEFRDKIHESIYGIQIKKRTERRD